MKNWFPRHATWEAAAARLGVGLPEVRAVFSVEAGGVFVDDDGAPPRRFEPHHVPAMIWPIIGFQPGGAAAWRASLRLGDLERREMAHITARKMGEEVSLRATSMGAPQIMGFNHDLCGYDSAVDMWNAFCSGADAQLDAFVSFLIANDLDGPLRAHDWRAFAAGYNGPANVDIYAPRLESAYRLESRGQRSPEILRLGARGQQVVKLQTALRNSGVFDDVIDGAFGPATLRAVKAFQENAGLTVDGVVGFQTWSQLLGDTALAPVRQPTVTEADNAERVRSAKTILPAVLGTGGVGAVMSDLSGDAQTIAIAAIAIAGLGALAVWAAPMIRRAWRGAAA